MYKKKSHPITFNQSKTIEEVDSIAQIFVEKKIEKNKIYDAYFGTELLDEVVVSGYVLTPNRKKMVKYRKPSAVVERKDILAKQPKWTNKLFDVLHHKFPDKITVARWRGYRYAFVGSRKDPTLVAIDGIPVNAYFYQYIENIPTSEVSSFEIIECARNSADFLRMNQPIECLNVISIYTHAGKGITGVKKLLV